MMPQPFPEDHEDPQEEEGWQQPPSSSLHGTVPNGKPTWVRRTRGLVLKTWEPKPLPPPQVDHELGHFSSLERSAEVFRYAFTKAEYWLSPGGWLREWVRLNARIAFLLAIPAMLVAPLVTRTLQQVSAWITLLTTTTSTLVLFPLSAVLVLGLVCGVIHLSRSFCLPRPRPQRSYYD